MYSITRNSGMMSGTHEPCLQCKKIVNIAAGLAVEVLDVGDGHEGYLHPNCRGTWEENNQGRRYVNL
jgi:hypothetical protein